MSRVEAEGTATGRFIRSCVNLSSVTVQTFYSETRDGMTCMLLVVFNTKNVKITNPKTRPRPMNFQDIKDKPGGKA